jgi:hypothetical protein
MHFGQQTIAWLLAASATWAQPVFVEKIVYRCPEPEMKEPAGRVADLVRGLSDAVPEHRQGRARALLEMGAGILPQLRWALQHGQNGGRPLSWDLQQLPDGNKWVQDPRNLKPWHTEHELDVLISHLEEQRRTAGSVITLHHTKAWLTNVLGDLGRQAETDVSVGDYYFPLEWVNTNRVTVNAERVNFWEALQVIRETTGLEPVHLNGQNRLVLQQAAQSAVSNLDGSVVVGVLRIAPISVVRMQIPRDAEGLGTRFRLTLAAFAEPKLTGTGPHAMVRITECLDDRGQSLEQIFQESTANLNGEGEAVPAGPPGHRCEVCKPTNGQREKFCSVESPNARMWTVPLDLRLPGPGRKIGTLKGEFSVGIGPADRYMTITNLLQAQGKTRELDGLQLIVSEVRKSGVDYHIRVEVSAPHGNPYTRTFTASADLEVWLWDQSRATIISRKEFNGVRQQNERTVGSWTLVTLHNSPAPATLVWKTPSETRWHTEPFESREITVP